MDYDKLWLKARIRDPRSWPTWELVKAYLIDGGRFLEIGPGNNPRIPVKKNSCFIETSLEAVKKLNSVGGKATLASAEKLPYQKAFFDLVCAFEVIEHIEEDEMALSEIYRVLKKNGTFIFSVPLFMKYWSAWDELAGHKRRYEPDELEEKLKRIGLFIEKFYTSGSPLFLFLRKGIFNYIFQRPIVFISRNLPSFSLAKLNNLCLLFSLSFKQTKLGKGRLRAIKNHHQAIVFCRKIC